MKQMNRPGKVQQALKGLAVLLLIIICTVPVLAATNASLNSVEWTFDRNGDLKGWQPNGHLKQVQVTNQCLNCQSAGSDPILTYQPKLELKATPWQVFEVRIKADRDGVCELFWSNTTEGKCGGFSQEKTLHFRVQGDGQWHDYRVMPFWQSEGRIVRLRFDLYDGANFSIAAMRIKELSMPAPALAPDFDFSKGPEGWQAINGAMLLAQKGGITVSHAGVGGMILAPALEIQADEQNYVVLRMKVEKGQRATLFYTSDKTTGQHSMTFPIIPDGREHTYNVDLMPAKEWRGRVVALGLCPTDVVGAKADLCWLKVSREPAGAPQLEVKHFLLEDALPRAGMPATLSASVMNTGGNAATNVSLTVSLPGNIRLLADQKTEQVVASLGFGEEKRFAWKVIGESTLASNALTARLSVRSGNAESVDATATLDFTPRQIVAKTGYVPEPHPVRGPVEVGVYYFPGWKSWSQWQPIMNYPERKPVLGWYREGDPELADWQIKWAVEHGITFFAYDWYWSKGARHLEQGLHDAYFKARYRHLLKFCLLWANHNPPNTSSHEDCLAVTKYWIENYFRRPEHLTHEGKPVVIIFSPHRLNSDMGSANVKVAFDAMREECRKAGLKGLYIIACVGSAGETQQVARDGYDAVTAYNWPGLGITDQSKRGPFDTLIDGYRRNWEHILEQGSLPMMLPICGGWDSRPWHGDNNLVRYGRTPELFKRHLMDAKAVLANNKRPGAITNMVLVEAWNEWGEGSYIEPHKEFGFGYLDAIRDVFTSASGPHVDITPADADMGPYELLQPPAPKSEWKFATGNEGWDNVMELSEIHFKDGVMSALSTGNDPAFFGPSIQVPAAEINNILIRMKLQRVDGKMFQDKAQLFWRTARWSESEASSIRFKVEGDGQWHEYSVPVADNRRWQGVITHLRLDPCNLPQVIIQLDSIRMQKK